MAERAVAVEKYSTVAQKHRVERIPLAERALVWFVLLILSGPPRVRPPGRLTEALESPLTILDPTALLHVGAWAGTGALVAYILCSQPHRARAWLHAVMDNMSTRWYLLFGLLGIASAAYSPSRIYTIFFAGKIVLGVLAVTMVCTYTRPHRLDQALRLLFAFMVIRAIALVVLYAIDPALVGTGGALFRDYRLDGGLVIGDYGESALLAGLWLLTVGMFGSTRAKRTAAMVGYGASWLLLLASETRSTITTGLLFFLIMVSLRRSARGRAALFAAGVLGLSLSVLWELGQIVIAAATRSGDGINTLSGRTEAFNYLIEWWSKSPILGYGYGAGTRTLLIDFVERTGLGIGAGHDILSTVLVDLGLLGAILLSLVFLATWGQLFVLWRRTRIFPRERVVVAQLVCLAVWVTNQCIVGPSIEAPSPPFFALIATAFALHIALRARRRPSLPDVRSNDIAAPPPSWREGTPDPGPRQSPAQPPRRWRVAQVPADPLRRRLP